MVGCDREAPVAVVLRNAVNPTDFFNDAGEHGLYCSAGVPPAGSEAFRQRFVRLNGTGWAGCPPDSRRDAGATLLSRTWLNALPIANCCFPRTGLASIPQPQSLRQ